MASGEDGGNASGMSRWNLGILNDKETIEVPGTVLLLASHRNRPLGLRNLPMRASHSSIPTGFQTNVPDRQAAHETERPGSGARTPSVASRSRPHTPQEAAPDTKKRTPDGAIILEPQPDDSANDPLNWQSWRRDIALLSLGFYCMVGGGTTPILAAGFTNVGEEYGVHTETVALTTGLYMMGMGVGSVIASPTAILFGKRPVYLVSAVIFIVTSLWAGYSPSFESLLAARVFQGMAVSPVECLPSATIAEIFFLHERAYRIGIYTLLLLGGKNLVPLVSAAIIGSLGWRWTFYILSMIIAFGGVLLFLFVPETFWDRTPTRKHKRSRRPSIIRRMSSRFGAQHHDPSASGHENLDAPATEEPLASGGLGAQGNEDPTHEVAAPDEGPASPRRRHDLHVRLADDLQTPEHQTEDMPEKEKAGTSSPSTSSDTILDGSPDNRATADAAAMPAPHGDAPSIGNSGSENMDVEKLSASHMDGLPRSMTYTHRLREQPAKSFVQQLRPYHGRLNSDKFLKVMLRPFILFAYPAVLWSAITYACSVGWLIVISETMAVIYRDPTSYNFSALQTGLVYISPFVGGILGTGVAGKVSDIVVRAMSRRNGGIYEPEFRLVMAIPMLITTCVGLMGFGWSAEQKDHWIVPTVFFGVVSFGCSLGSTTSITFVVDSYRQYAGEALVTLNFSKNIFHGLVFSFFVGHWLEDDGPKMVYIWIGIIQLILLLLTIPMYIYGKRARMWTVRKNFMEKF